MSPERDAVLAIVAKRNGWYVVDTPGRGRVGALVDVGGGRPRGCRLRRPRDCPGWALVGVGLSLDRVGGDG